ncbi:MAG: hypothetical protein Tsb005_17740 [Gammaproteobacteria bacterium]
MPIIDDTVDSLLSRAKTHQAAAEWQAALTCYQQALAVDEQDPWTWLSHGYVLVKLERTEEALTSFQRGLTLDEKDPWAWLSHGYVLAELGRTEEALASFERALVLDEKYTAAWYHQGLALAKLGRTEEALASFERAVDEKSPLAWLNQGTELARLGLAQEALASFERAVALDEKYTTAWYHQGLALTKLGRIEEALTSFERAVTLDEKYTTAWLSQGHALTKLGRIEEALTSFERAVALDEKDPSAWGDKGLTHLYLGQYAQAHACFQQALTLHNNGWALMIYAVHALQASDPTHPHITTYLTQLEHPDILAFTAHLMKDLHALIYQARALQALHQQQHALHHTELTKITPLWPDIRPADKQTILLLRYAVYLDGLKDLTLATKTVEALTALNVPAAMLNHVQLRLQARKQAVALSEAVDATLSLLEQYAVQPSADTTFVAGMRDYLYYYQSLTTPLASEQHSTVMTQLDEYQQQLKLLIQPVNSLSASMLPPAPAPVSQPTPAQHWSQLQVATETDNPVEVTTFVTAQTDAAQRYAQEVQGHLSHHDQQIAQAQREREDLAQELQLLRNQYSDEAEALRTRLAVTDAQIAELHANQQALQEVNKHALAYRDALQMFKQSGKQTFYFETLYIQLEALLLRLKIEASHGGKPTVTGHSKTAGLVLEGIIDGTQAIPIIGQGLSSGIKWFVGKPLTAIANARAGYAAEAIANQMIDSELKHQAVVIAHQLTQRYAELIERAVSITEADAQRGTLAKQGQKLKQKLTQARPISPVQQLALYALTECIGALYAVTRTPSDKMLAQAVLDHLYTQWRPYTSASTWWHTLKAKGLKLMQNIDVVYLSINGRTRECPLVDVYRELGLRTPIGECFTPTGEALAYGYYLGSIDEMHALGWKQVKQASTPATGQASTQYFLTVTDDIKQSTEVAANKTQQTLIRQGAHVDAKLEQQKTAFQSQIAALERAHEANKAQYNKQLEDMARKHEQELAEMEQRIIAKLNLQPSQQSPSNMPPSPHRQAAVLTPKRMPSPQRVSSSSLASPTTRVAPSSISQSRASMFGSPKVSRQPPRQDSLPSRGSGTAPSSPSRS